MRFFSATPAAIILSLGLASAGLFGQTPSSNPPGPAQGAADPAAEAAAQQKKLQELGMIESGIGKIGVNAEINVPEGFAFFPAKGAKVIMQQWGNLTSGNEDGLLIENKTGWSVLFQFDKVGYVKDDEKADLNAADMMKQMKDSEPAANEARKEAGLPAQHTLGFVMEPKYNETTHNLEWATKFSVEGHPGEFVNYHTKLLGREGVMNATLMVEPDQLQAVLPDYQKALTGYHFLAGKTYAEYRSGDNLAAYGLTGLVVGGAGIAAAKMGLFAKLGAIIAKGGKIVIAGIALVAAAIWKFIGKLIGRRDPNTLGE